MTGTLTTERPSAARTSRLRTVLVALITTALTVGLSITAAPAFAAATVKIDSVEFENSEFEDGSRQSLKVDWSIDGGATNPVTLEVDFPDGLEGYPDSFPMKGPGGADAGVCVVTEGRTESGTVIPPRISCTVDPMFILSNPYGVSGSFWFNVSTDIRNAADESKTFEFGGVTVPMVVIHPDADTCTTTCTLVAPSYRKYGSYNSLDNVITWTVQLPATDQGMDVGKNVVVTDTLDTTIFENLTDYAGETWPQLWEGRCIRVTSSNAEQPRWVDRSDEDWVSWTPNKTEVSFTTRDGAMGGSCVTSPGGRLTTCSFYQVIWKVKVKDLGVAGTYNNTASFRIDGLDQGSRTGSATRRSGGGSVDGGNFGRFWVTKRLDGNTVLNPTFTANWTSYHVTDLLLATPLDTGTFEVKEGQVYASPDFPRDTRVILSEAQPAGPANVAWGTPVFVDSGGTQLPDFVGPGGTLLAEIVFSDANGNLGDGKIVEVTLVNEATLRTGTLKARKVVENPDGLDLSAIAGYRVDYSRESAWEIRGIPNITGGGFTLNADGTELLITDWPGDVGYAFYEGFFAAPTPIPGATWADPVYMVNGVRVNAFDRVNLPVGGELELVVINRITRDTPLTPITPMTGAFSVAKVITGDGASLVPTGTEFTVSYEYPAGIGHAAGAGTVTVPADGTAAVVDALPYGAVVTLTETAPAAIDGATWAGATFSTDTVTIGNGTTVAVTLTNTVTADAVDPVDQVDPADQDPSDELAVTGVTAETFALIPVGMLLMLVGSAVLYASRRRSAA